MRKGDTKQPPARFKRKPVPTSASYYPRLPVALRQALDHVLDLTSASKYCSKQAKSAAIFKDAVEEVGPGKFVLKSPFKESFLGSLHLYEVPNARFNSADTIAQGLRRHAEWYLGGERVDILRDRFGERRPQPRLLRGDMQFWEGLIDETGNFSFDVTSAGTPAILGWQDIAGSEADGSAGSIAIEVSSYGPTGDGAAFKRNLIESATKTLTRKLGLSSARPGRPHNREVADRAAYLRDHLQKPPSSIAKDLCSVVHEKHTRQCYDRLNKLADSFYKTTTVELQRLVRERAETIPK